MTAQQSAADRDEVSSLDYQGRQNKKNADEERRRYALSIAIHVQRLWTAGDLIQSANEIEKYIKEGGPAQSTRSGPLADAVHAIAAEAAATRNSLQAGEDPEDVPVPVPAAPAGIYTGLERLPEGRAEDGEEIPF